MKNYLGISQLIITQLDTILGKEVVLAPLPPLGDMLEAEQAMTHQPAPAVHVFFKGHKPGQRRVEKRHIEQEWYVVIVVKNVTDLSRASEAEEEAGQLLTQVLNALDGWRPIVNESPDEPFFSPLEWIDALPTYWHLGFMHLPLIFRNQFVYHIEREFPSD